MSDTGRVNRFHHECILPWNLLWVRLLSVCVRESLTRLRRSCDSHQIDNKQREVRLKKHLTGQFGDCLRLKA